MTSEQQSEESEICNSPGLGPDMQQSLDSLGVEYLSLCPKGQANTFQTPTQPALWSLHKKHKEGLSKQSCQK